MKMNTQTHDIALELIQSTLDESFVDANNSLHQLMAIKAQEKLNEMREDIASNLITEISNDTVRSAFYKRQNAAWDSQEAANQSHSVNGYRKTPEQMSKDIAKSDADVAKRNNFMDLAGKRLNRRMGVS